MTTSIFRGRITGIAKALPQTQVKKQLEKPGFG
jgi:hypothetical protein